MSSPHEDSSPWKKAAKRDHESSFGGHGSESSFDESLEETPEKRLKLEKDSSPMPGTSGHQGSSERETEKTEDILRKSISIEDAVDEKEHKSKKAKQEEERIKMQVLVSKFSEDQLNRYEMFRRAAFPKAAIKRLMQSISGAGISQNAVIAMAGIAKVFVGEVVETALDTKESLGESGPLQPKHLRESVRQMKKQNAIPNTKYRKKLFR